MTTSGITIRPAKPEEFKRVGELMVQVYSQLEGFPKPEEQPEYYETLLNVGDFTKKGNTELLVALSRKNRVVGAVLFFGDMKYYGSGGTATGIQNASAFRLLTVDPNQRGKGIGKLLCLECIKRAKHLNHHQLLIHSTESMKVARSMYKGLGFVRYKAIDFYQKDLPVFGFQLNLDSWR